MCTVYPPQKYVCKYVKIKIAESCINNIRFPYKLLSNRKFPNNFYWGIIDLHKIQDTPTAVDLSWPLG